MTLRVAAGLAKPASKEPPPSGFQQGLDVWVHYEDTDFTGNVYHASYLRFLERGRTDLLRGLGIEHSRIFDRGGAKSCYFVVRAMTIEFLKPAIMAARQSRCTKKFGAGR